MSFDLEEFLGMPLYLLINKKTPIISHLTFFLFTKSFLSIGVILKNGVNRLEKIVPFIVQRNCPSSKIKTLLRF